MCSLQEMKCILAELSRLEGVAQNLGVESVVECVVDAGRSAGHRGAHVDRDRVQSMIEIDVEQLRKGASVDELPTVSLFTFLNDSQ